MVLKRGGKEMDVEMSAANNVDTRNVENRLRAIGTSIL
jgi:hypothetical protein